MCKEILRTMDAEALYVSAALILFFSYFLYVLIDTMRKPKGEMEHLEQLPLDD